MKIEERNPLLWPVGFPRTKNPGESRFGDHTVSKAIDEVIRQLTLLRAQSATISANGFLRATPIDKGVAVYFKIQTSYYPKEIIKSFVVPCDKWNRLEDNFWAVAKHIEAMRGQSRWGCGNLERDFMGYTALEENNANSWPSILQIPPNSGVEVIKEAYRQLAKKYHPDLGGSHDKMTALTKAYEEALRLRGVS